MLEIAVKIASDDDCTTKLLNAKNRPIIGRFLVKFARS